MKRFMMAVVVAAGLGLATGSTHAQESTGPTGPTATVPGIPAVPTAGERLTLEQLGRLLQQLGYNPKPYNDDAGKLAGYDLEFTSNGWTMRLSVSLSGDGSNIWLNSTIGRISNPGMAPGAALLKLFGDHNRIWPAYVYFNSGSGSLRLAMPIKNSGLNASLLKKEIDSYAAKLQQMITLWRTSQAAPTAPAPVR